VSVTGSRNSGRMAGSALFSAVCAQAVAPGHSSAPKDSEGSDRQQLNQATRVERVAERKFVHEGTLGLCDFRLVAEPKTCCSARRAAMTGSKRPKTPRSRADLEKTIAEALDSHCTA